MLYVKEWFSELIIQEKDSESASRSFKDTEFPEMHRIHRGDSQTLIACNIDPRKFPDAEILLQKILQSIDLEYTKCTIFVTEASGFELSEQHFWLCFFDSETASKLKHFNARPFWTHPKALIAPSLPELVADPLAKKKLWAELQKRSWK